MPRKKRLAAFVAAFSVILASLVVTTPMFAASKEKVLYSFCSANNCADGGTPFAGLIFDANGHLYGTTDLGGAQSYGSVFELTLKNGKWIEKVLHSFDYKDGAYPLAGLTLDSAGNLYGTTSEGGIGQCQAAGYVVGCGTVFELTPQANGQWAGKVLHRFDDNGKDGTTPEAGLILDSSGNLYGTTFWGGAGRCLDKGTYLGCGTVFRLAPQVGGQWTEKVLHNFNPNHKDGTSPGAGLTFDSAGNLYGTTSIGGRYGAGVVFMLTPGTEGNYTEKVLHTFGKPRDGADSLSSVTLDAIGNLYGTTFWGGPHDSGTVFRLTPGTGGTWSEKVLHSFGANKDGMYSLGGLIFDRAGNLYGVTQLGGAYEGQGCGGAGCGTVFRLSPGTNGKWTEKVLHSFNNYKSADGAWVDGIIFDANGNLYGTTGGGGAHGNGTVFEITP